MSLSKSYCLIATNIFSPSILNEYPLIAEKTAINTVRMTNCNDPPIKSPFYLMISTICPHRSGNRTMPPAEIAKLTFATKSNSLFLQVYPKSLPNVFPACFAFLTYFYLFGS